MGEIRSEPDDLSDQVIMSATSVVSDYSNHEILQNSFPKSFYLAACLVIIVLKLTNCVCCWG